MAPEPQIDPLDRWALASRRRRVLLWVTLALLCAGYVIWWAVDRHSATAGSPVRSWFAVCVATGFFFVLAERIHTEFRDPRRAEREAGERAARHAEQMADFNDWGIKVAGAAILAMIVGGVVAATLWEFGGLALVVIAAFTLSWAPRKRPPWAGGRRRAY